MRKKRLIIFILILLTVINVVIFVFRDHFHYIPYSDHDKLYASCTGDCRGKWKQYVEDYPAAELYEAKLITDSLLGKPGKHTIDKVISIINFIYSRFNKQSGTPSAALLSASPLQQYKMLTYSDSLQLWCGNYAQIFSWFCWSQGIVTRNIEIMKPGDRHVLNECYIPEEEKWVMADLTNNLMVADYTENSYADLHAFRMSLSDTAMGLTAWRWDSVDSVMLPLEKNDPIIKNYYQEKYPLYYYQRTNNEKVYQMAEKIKRYFLPVYWYYILDEDSRKNTAFYIKELFLFLWLITVFVFMASLTKFRI